MKCLKSKNHFVVAVLAIASFTACKKNEVISDSAVAAADSATEAAQRAKRTPPPPPSTTTTYYISTSGNDATGTGTSASPWKTLYKATSTVSTSGAVIHVNAGTYTETMTCNLQPGVSIEGDGTTSVVQTTLTGDWTSLLALHSSSEGVNGNQHVSNIKFDGQNLSSFYAITVAGRSNVSIHDITVVNFKEGAVIFGGRADNTEAAPGTYATGNSFYNNTLLNCSRYEGWGRGCFGIGGQDGMLVYNNVITQNQRPAGSNGYCVKYTNGGWNKGCKIYGNTFTRAQSAGGDFYFCVELFNTSGLEVNNNVFNGGALDMNYQTKGSYAYSVWVHDNQFLQPNVNLTANQSGIVMEFGSESEIIENNVFSKQNYGISFVPREGNTIKDIVIRKNLMTGIASGVWGGSYINFNDLNSYVVSNVSIYNNTLEYDRANSFWTGIILPSAAAGNFSNINIKNNIIAGAKAAAVGQSGASSVSSLAIQYNDVYNSGTAASIATTGSGYLLSNNITTVPTYGANYTLVSGSPLINAGVNVGLSFNGTAPDIGYAEF